MKKTITALLTLGTALAMPSSIMTREDSPKSVLWRLLIGAPYQILTAYFDGSKFSIAGNYTVVGTAPSWMITDSPNRIYAVNENANDVSLFTLDSDLSDPKFVSSANGSSGVVSLSLNANGTHMVGAAYGSGMIDVWNVSSCDGSLTLLKSIPVPGDPNPAQGAHHPHQALLEPTGRYFIIPNLGGDSILVLDSKDDKYEITNVVKLPTNTGPRHGGFAVNVKGPHYVMVSELSNEVFLFQLSFDEDTLNFKQVQVQSSYGTDPPANASSAAAGELVTDGVTDVFVSNRISGNETDSIAHFKLSDNDTLDYVESVSSGGLRPRMFSVSLDPDQSFFFVANQGGENGLVALQRYKDSGRLNPTPVATLPNAAIVAPQLAATEFMGPQFVRQI